MDITSQPPTVSDELSTSEQASLIEQEATITRGMRTFVEVGEALLKIRDQRLYRKDYNDFDHYCRVRWGWSRQRAYQQIQAAEVVGNLSTIVDTPMPKTESQARPLARLLPEEQREAWVAAVELAQGPPTAQQVAQIVKPTKVARPAGKDRMDGFRRLVGAVMVFPDLTDADLRFIMAASSPETTAAWASSLEKAVPSIRRIAKTLRESL